MDTDLKLPATLLKNLGLNLEKIPEGERKTPDLRGSDGTADFLVEVKSKFDGIEIQTKREKAQYTGEILEESHAVIRQNVIAGIFRQAAEQLATASEFELRLIVFNGCGHHSDVQIEQAEATFYGSVQVYDLDSSESFNCYFFSYNECYPLKNEVDALFVMTDSKAKLCLNPFSPRYRKLQETDFYQRIHPHVNDPLVEEEQGAALIVNGEIDRSDKNKVLHHLQEKYKRPRLIDLSGMTHYSASIFIPKNDTGNSQADESHLS